MFLDPEVRRVLLEEIAFQRSERGKFRAIAADEAEAEPSGIVLRARLRAEGCNQAIRAIREVWDRLVSVERRHAEDALAAENPINGAWLARVGDLSDWAPGELQEAFGS
ncbi:MAG TPA: hypothetical protein VLM76_06380 [Patescibacteria group bacterium]|nr:hypothetical protein [Patescibacteria group bacterium]